MTLLERMRVDRGMSVAQVAEAAGLAHNTVVRAEAGNPLTAHTAKRLADVYGMSGSELMLAVRREAETAGPDEREAA